MGQSVSFRTADDAVLLLDLLILMSKLEIDETHVYKDRSQLINVALYQYMRDVVSDFMKNEALTPLFLQLLDKRGLSHLVEGGTLNLTWDGTETGAAGTP